MAIKSEPEDFVVEEELAPGFLAEVTSRPSRFALYAVRKRLLTTHEMLDALTRRLKMPLSAWTAAGLKDKQAVTTQHVTLRLDPHGRPPPESIQGDGYDARLLGYVPNEIDSRAILRNRFEIVVRARNAAAIVEMSQAAMRYASADTANGTNRGRLLIVNYFGNQRFGSARAGEGFVASHLVRGEFQDALRLAIATPHRKDERRVKAFKQCVADVWESRSWSNVLKESHRVVERAAIEHLARQPDDFRGAFAALPYFFQQLCVEAYQSLLWNRIAAMLIIDRLGESGRLWVVDDTYCQLVFPESSAIPDDLRSLEIPLLARKSKMVEPWRSAAVRVFEEERLSGPEALRIPGMDRPWFGESPRALFMSTDGFRMGDAPRDKRASSRDHSSRVSMAFTLPRGGYATVLLRALGE